MSKVQNEAMNEKVGQSMDIKVRIHSIKPEGGLRARCSVELGGGFAVRGVRLMEGAHGHFLSMPSYKVGEGYKDICFATTKAFRQLMLDAVVQEYEQALQQANLANQHQINQHEQAAQAPAAPQPQAAQTTLPGYAPNSIYLAGM